MPYTVVCVTAPIVRFLFLRTFVCTYFSETIECFHMTSRRPYWCPKTMKRRPCWCPKPVLWDLNSFLMQTLSFVPINLHRCWPREWKRSIVFDRVGQIEETKNDSAMFMLLLHTFLVDVSDEEAQISNRSKRKVSFCPPQLSKRIKDTGISYFMLQLMMMLKF